MAGVDEYSGTAASNGTIHSIDIADGCQPSGINNAIRQLMADVRRYLNDLGAKAVSSGTDTVTLTTETVFTAYADGTMLAFIAGGTNTGAATLNVDSVGAKAIRKGADTALAAGDITAGKVCIVVYDASANSAAGAWLLANPNLGALQPLDDDLTAIAALTTTSYGRNLLTLADQAALKTAVGAASDSASGIVELATSAETITGTDTARAVTPAGGAAAYEALGKVRESPVKTDNYTLAATDAGKTVEMNASAKTITIPTNASVAFPVDSYVNVVLVADSTLTIEGDTGVTVNGVSGGAVTISAQYGGVTLYKRDTNEWVIPNAVAE